MAVCLGVHLYIMQLVLCVCVPVREKECLRAATGCICVPCGLRVKPSAAAAVAVAVEEQRQIPLLVSAASNQLLLIVKESMRVESQCALKAAERSITACC